MSFIGNQVNEGVGVFGDVFNNAFGAVALTVMLFLVLWLLAKNDML